MKSLPRLSVENPVLVNVAMVALIAGGVYAGLTMVREMFPESRPNQVMISVLYPGATPEEVEQGLALRIEEAVKDVENIDKIETSITEGICTVAIQLTNDVEDLDRTVNDFKAAIDAIPRDELPEDAEEIQVRRAEPRLPVISVAVYGELDEATLKATGQQLRDEILLLPDISDVVLTGTRKGEITAEVRPDKLVEYGLSFAAVAGAIRQANLDLPAGQVKTPGQNVAVRTLGETDEAEQIAETIVRTSPTGEVVRVHDLGRVIDAFEDRELRGRFNGQPGVDITIYKTGDQDAIEIAEKVRAFIAGKQRQPIEWDWLTRLKNVFGVRTEAQRAYEQAWNDPLSAAIHLDTHNNLARYVSSRLDLLQRNGFWGLLFVFGSLLLFLNWRVAFWVMIGLVLAICGTALFMAALGETLNLISMFGLIIVLGLIVDDAIVVGENIYARVEQGEDPHVAAVQGTEEVTWPVIIAVTTTIGAFLPLLFIEGRIGDFMGVLPIVVTCALSVSLFEALSMLPCHLADTLKAGHRKSNGRRAADHRPGWILRLREKQRRTLQVHLTNAYERILRLCVRYRYVTVAAMLALTLVTLGLVAGGRVPFVFIQKMDSETVLVNLRMPVGTPADGTQAAIQVVEDATLALRERNELSSIYSIVGAQIAASEFGAAIDFRSHLGQAIIELSPVDQRSRSSEEIIAELRSRTKHIPGVNTLKFEPMQGGPGGNDIEIEVSGNRIPDILAVAEALQDKLATKQGVYDITDDYEQGRREIQVELLESARPLNLTTQALATEIRGAFFGLEARTLQREREDVDIRVRFPEDFRTSIAELERMRITTADGRAIPLREVARLRETRGAAAIHRIDQRRAVVVTADVNQDQADANQVIAELGPLIAGLQREYPGVNVDFAGNKSETAKSFGSLKRDFLAAICIIFVMLAGLFRSYVQPLIVLLAVPFGLNGAVLGHLVMGYPLTMLSVIGLVALTGIVVNDSLILVDFINRSVAAGVPHEEAVILGGRRRLRPIILTSLTTILGLAPMLTETSFQARFLIPMAISISFGLMFATLLTLLLVPAANMIVQDALAVGRRIWHGPAPAGATGAPR